MRTLTLAGVVLLVAAGLAAVPGCGGKGKELPKDVHVGNGKTDAPAVVVPTKSEPAAVAVVEKALKSATDGHPERVNKAKVNRLKLKGTIVHLDRPQPTIRTVEAVWADRFAFTDEFNDGLPTKVFIRLRRPVLWIGKNREGQTVPVEFGESKDREAAVAAESIGRHWMSLLVPLADAKTIVFAARKETINGQTADVIKAALPGSPVFTLWFDEKTGLLGRIDFDQVEPGNTTPTKKFFALFQHRAFDGLTLPARIVYHQNALPVEEWNVDAWEFPERIDDAAFDAPK